MTTVNISGTWSEKQRPNNGLERVAEHIHGNRLVRVPVVGYVEFHQYTERRTGNVLTVAIPAIEPALEADGTDPDGVGQKLWDALDQLRKKHGKGAVEDDLFSLPRDAFDPDPDGDEMDGQMRLGAGGPREVPPPSGEEIVAELDERRAAKGKAAADPFNAKGGDNA